MSIRGDMGPQVIEDLFQRMMIDEEWSVRRERSFTWWGHRLAQHVRAEPVRESFGDDVVRVQAMTDLLKSVPDNGRTSDLLSALNTHASLSAFLWDRSRGRVTLISSAYFHAQNLPWLRLTFAGACAIQAADAHIKVDGLAEMLGAAPDESHHPTSGPRTVADDMLNVIERLFAAEGQKPSPFSREDFDSLLELPSAPWLLANADDTALTAELPFPGCRPPTALLRVDTEEKHPQLGSGALMLLKLPVSPGPEGAAVVSHKLNAAETTGWACSHQLGAWCSDPEVQGVTFVSFVPTALYKPGLLENLVYSMAIRARWANEFLASGRGIPTQFAERDPASFERQLQEYQKMQKGFLDRLKELN